MSSTEVVSQKKIGNNRKILTDYPYLWAVVDQSRLGWNLGRDDLQVKSIRELDFSVVPFPEGHTMESDCWFVKYTATWESGIGLQKRKERREAILDCKNRPGEDLWNIIRMTILQVRYSIDSIDVLVKKELAGPFGETVIRIYRVPRALDLYAKLVNNIRP